MHNSDHSSDDKVTKNTSMLELCRALWPFLMRQKGALGLVLLATGLLAFIGRITVWYFGIAVDEGIKQQNHKLIVEIAALFLGLEVVRFVCNFLHVYVFAKIGNRILHELRIDLVRHVQSLPIAFFDRTPSGRIVTRLTTDVVGLGEVFSQGIIQIFSNLISLAAIVVAMFAISVKMATVSLMVAPVLIAIGFGISHQLRHVLRAGKTKMAALNSFLAESINGMRILQLHNREGRRAIEYKNLNAEYTQNQFQAVNLYALLWPSVAFFNGVSVAVALYYGGIITAEHAITTGAMIAFTIHVRDFVTPIRVILEKYQFFQNSLASAERLLTLLGEKSEVDAGILRPSTFTGQIEFRDVSFRYQPSLPLAVENINLTIRPGESVAFVGRTGSGKSTFISLLQGFYRPVGGQILLDGTDLRELKLNYVRSQLGVVQQDAFMFKASIKDNVSLGDARISEEQVIAALKQACCQELLIRHDGIHAQVEERGANLSLGERQLIAFARVLAFNPNILILDEATANIDSHSELKIRQATRNLTKNRTSIIIAHRISTILDCDRIVLLESGRLLEVGTHQELMQRKSAYYELCCSQWSEQHGKKPELSLAQT